MNTSENAGGAAIDLFRQHHCNLLNERCDSPGHSSSHTVRHVRCRHPATAESGAISAGESASASQSRSGDCRSQNAEAVVCLVSGLAFFNLTTQIPHAVDVALPRGAATPRMDYPPLRLFRFSGPAWNEGVTVHQIDETPVRIYEPAKRWPIASSFAADLALILHWRRYVSTRRISASPLIH